MKTTTPQKLSNRLIKYSALSFAIATIGDANGQIVYTDLNPDLGGSGQVDHFIDLDNNGTDDIRFRHGNSYSNSNLYAFNLNGNSVMGLANYVGNRYYYYPFALDINTTISAAATWQSHSSQLMNYSDCNSPSQWCGVTDKYIGLRFKIGSNTHYGWIRLDVDITSANWKIKDYAYNASLAGRGILAEGASIMAGEGMPLGIDDNVFSGVKVVALNKNIALFNLPQNTNYRLFSLTGQSVLDGQIENETYVLEVNTIATGIYIIELEDANSNTIFRKKVVL